LVVAFRLVHVLGPSVRPATVTAGTHGSTLRRQYGLAMAVGNAVDGHYRSPEFLDRVNVNFANRLRESLGALV